MNTVEGNRRTEEKVFAVYERKNKSVAFTAQQEGCFLTNSMIESEFEIQGVFNPSPFSGIVDSYPYINFADTPENELSYTGLNDNIVETGGRGKFATIFFEDSFSSAVNIGDDIYLKIKGTVVVDNIGDSDTNVFGDDIEYQYPSNRLSLIGFRTSNYSATQIIPPDDSCAPLGINDNIDLTKDVDGTVTDIQGFESLVDTNAIYSFTHDSLFGEHEKFTIESDSTSVDNNNSFINLGFYGQFNNDNFGDYSQKYAHTLYIYGIRFVTRAVNEGAR